MAENIEWKCFHCGQGFTREQERWAREHFGRDEGETPVCLMRVPGEGGLLAALRKAQDELAAYRNEDTELMRSLYALAADYEQRLIREEEIGYARGLRDFTAVESVLRELWESLNSFGYENPHCDPDLVRIVPKELEDRIRLILGEK